MDHSLHELQNGWNPHTLPHCMDSPTLALITACLAMLTVVQYAFIAMHFFHTLQKSYGPLKRAVLCMLVIFVLCGLTGYFPIFLAVKMPAMAIWVRVVGLILLQPFCFGFHAEIKKVGDANALAKSSLEGNRSTAKSYDIETLNNEELRRLSLRITSEISQRMVNREQKQEV